MKRAAVPRPAPSAYLTAIRVVGGFLAARTLQPALEHDDRPQPPCVVGCAAAMLVEQAADAIRPDPTLGLQAPRLQHAVDLPPQAPVDPRGDRHAEASLLAAQDGAR